MRADELIATRQVTPATIGAAHDVTMFEEERDAAAA